MVICPLCGRPNDQGARFCRGCEKLLLPPYPSALPVAAGHPLPSDVRAIEPGSPAGFWPRFGALSIDLCLQATIWFALLVVAAALGSGLLAGIFTLAVQPVYYIAFWSAEGRTPGYRATGLQLIQEDGRKPSIALSTLRYLGLLLGALCLGLGALWMLWDRQGQTWHDKLASTTVVNMR